MTVIQDSSGFQIFSDSDIGSANVTAHRMLDLGRLDRGHQLLGKWLDGRTGRGSEWVHIQWHMLVFELAVGEWKSARARFETHVLPAARESDQAVTDAQILVMPDMKCDLPKNRMSVFLAGATLDDALDEFVRAVRREGFLVRDPAPDFEHQVAAGEICDKLRRLVGGRRAVMVAGGAAGKPTS